MDLCGILVTYVDDFVYCGTLNWHRNVVEDFFVSLRSTREKRDHSDTSGSLLCRQLKKFLMVKIALQAV